VFPTGHVGVLLVGGMIVKFLKLFIGAVSHSQNMTSDRVREKKHQEHGRMLTRGQDPCLLQCQVGKCSFAHRCTLTVVVDNKIEILKRGKLKSTEDFIYLFSYPK
jgi:hypothetical protein